MDERTFTSVSIPEQSSDNSIQSEKTNLLASDNKEDDEMPLDMLKEPYLAKYYNFTEYGYLKVRPEEDFEKLVDKVSQVEDYIKSQIAERKINPTIKSWKAMIMELENNFPDMELQDNIKRLNRLLVYLTGQNKIKLLQEKIAKIREKTYAS